MKKLLSALALAAGALLAAPASAAITVGFTPSSTHIDIGDSVVIDMSISGLGDEILSAFDVNAVWDSSIARYTVATLFCNQFGANPICVWDTLLQGNLGGQSSSTQPDDDIAAIQPNSFLVARFTLQGVADGVTTLTLGPSVDFERNFVGLDFTTLDVSVGSACIAVGTGSCGGGNDAPEPASFGLAGVALLAAGWAGRSRRRSRAAA
jgi:hypothetical protein